MGRGAPKDLFIIHTKSKEIDRNTVGWLAGLLLPARYKIWNYKDWDWYEKPPVWLAAAALDDNRLMPSKEVDREHLDVILSRTRAVIFLYPSDNCLTEGMKEELMCLRHAEFPYMFDEQTLDEIKQIHIWCAFEAYNFESYSVDTEGHHAGLQVLLKEGIPDSISIANIAVVLATHLIKQRVDYINSLPGDVEDVLSRLFGSPEQELSRASILLDRIQDYGSSNASEPLVKSINELRNARRYAKKVFDDNWWRYPDSKK
jgi:hypothetical protein